MNDINSKMNDLKLNELSIPDRIRNGENLVTNSSGLLNSVLCPWCERENEYESISCGIFRCGKYVHNGEQIPPHFPKTECDKLFQVLYKTDYFRTDIPQDKKIWGCSKPYEVKNINGKYITEKCDYK